MKGLDLCEAYYHACGSEMIRSKFAHYEDRIAVGLVGEGSDCFGFDDEISRDHDWGPGFCLWLETSCYDAVGPTLESEYQKLPQTFENFERISSRWGKSRVGVMEIGAFYRGYIGLSQAPEEIELWFRIPERNLAACTNGRVFQDPPGRFSAIREDLLSFFPEDVRLAKIVAHCASAAQAGQYNYPRLVKRSEYFAAQYAVTKFCADIISLVFLLNRRFCPFYKWSHRAVRDLQLMGGFIHSRVSDLTTEHDVKNKVDIIEDISSAVISALQFQNLSTCAGDFLLDHAASVTDKISDPRILKRAKSLV